MTDIDMDVFDHDNEGYDNDDIIDTNIDEQGDRFQTPSGDSVIPKTTRLQSDEIKRQKIQQLASHLGISEYDPKLIDLKRIVVEKTSIWFIALKVLEKQWRVELI